MNAVCILCPASPLCQCLIEGLKISVHERMPSSVKNNTRNNITNKRGSASTLRTQVIPTRMRTVHQALSLGLKLLANHDPVKEQSGGYASAYTVTLRQEFWEDNGLAKVIRCEDGWLIVYNNPYNNNDSNRKHGSVSMWKTQLDVLRASIRYLTLGTDYLDACDIQVTCKGKHQMSLRRCNAKDLASCSLVHENVKLSKPFPGSNATFSHRWNWQHSKMKTEHSRMKTEQQDGKLRRALTGLRAGIPDVMRFPNAHAESESLKKVASVWTSELYIVVQNAMRRGASVGARAERLRAELATYMLLLSLRSPTLPRQAQQTQYLYRGISGSSAVRLQSDGVLHDQGFISFSTDLQVASSFTLSHESNGMLLKLPIKSLPKGTPWLWFGYNGVVSEAPGEHEVLLPPGMLKLITHGNANGVGVTVKYVPDYSDFDKVLVKGALRREVSV